GAQRHAMSATHVAAKSVAPMARAFFLWRIERAFMGQGRAGNTRISARGPAGHRRGKSGEIGREQPLLVDGGAQLQPFHLCEGDGWIASLFLEKRECSRQGHRSLIGG
ncbi:MAG: hypothetical protein ACI80K_004650, partial [Paracoccaceae bacterium]